MAFSRIKKGRARAKRSYVYFLCVFLLIAGSALKLVEGQW